MKNLESLPFRDLSAQMEFGHPAFIFYVHRCGMFRIPLSSSVFARAVVDNGVNEPMWEHVSVSILEQERCPTWEEMCFVKNFFWNEEDTVLQFHPPKSEYVNTHPYCLHLWRYKGTIPRPNPKSVGLP